jgi:hypothetical protein
VVLIVALLLVTNKPLSDILVCCKRLTYLNNEVLGFLPHTPLQLRGKQGFFQLIRVELSFSVHLSPLFVYFQHLLLQFLLKTQLQLFLLILLSSRIHKRLALIIALATQALREGCACFLGRIFSNSDFFLFLDSCLSLEVSIVKEKHSLDLG